MVKAAAAGKTHQVLHKKFLISRGSKIKWVMSDASYQLSGVLNCLGLEAQDQDTRQ